MAAARYSSDVLEMYYGRIEEANQSLHEPLVPRSVTRFDGVLKSPTDVEFEEIIKLDEAIQSLPPELREKIKKDLVAIKIRERNEMGWNEVHEDIEEPKKDIMDLYPAELKDLLDYNQVDVETRERIYEEFNEIKRAERKEMGWNEVHDDIKDAPFCEKRLRITKVLFCFKCNSCQRNGLCELCRKNGEIHNLGYPIYSIEDYPEIFIKAY